MESWGNYGGRGTGTWREERMRRIKDQECLFCTQGWKMQTMAPLTPSSSRKDPGSPVYNPLPTQPPTQPVFTTTSHR